MFRLLQMRFPLRRLRKRLLTVLQPLRHPLQRLRPLFLPQPPPQSLVLLLLAQASKTPPFAIVRSHVRSALALAAG